MKREGPGMPIEKQTKKTMTDAGIQEEAPLSPSEPSSARSSPTAGLENARNDTNPAVRFPTVDRRMYPQPSTNHDPATEKLGPIPLINMSFLSRSLQGPVHHPFPRPVRPRVSREEFRQRLIETIDEALRIIDDDSDLEHSSPEGL